MLVDGVGSLSMAGLFPVILYMCACVFVFLRFAYNVFCLRLWIEACSERQFPVMAGSLLG